MFPRMTETTKITFPSGNLVESNLQNFKTDYGSSAKILSCHFDISEFEQRVSKVSPAGINCMLLITSSKVWFLQT